MSLEEVVFNDGPIGVRQIEGQLRQMDERTYQYYRAARFVSILRPWLKEASQVVELGCGWGRNVLWFESAFPESTFCGMDISPTGVEFARWLAERFGSKSQFLAGDMTAFPAELHETTNQSNLPLVVYTLASLEQLKYDTRQVLENILALKPAVVIHFEPIYELLGAHAGSRDHLNRLYIKHYDYQDNLWALLGSWAREGRINLYESRRLGFSGNPIRELGLAIWQPAHASVFREKQAAPQPAASAA